MEIAFTFIALYGPSGICRQTVKLTDDRWMDRRKDEGRPRHSTSHDGHEGHFDISLQGVEFDSLFKLHYLYRTLDRHLFLNKGYTWGFLSRERTIIRGGVGPFLHETNACAIWVKV